MTDLNSLKVRIRTLALRQFPKNAICKDAQTLSYGVANERFIRACEVDLDLSKLEGLGGFASHLNANAYGILVARTLLKYLNLCSGSESDLETALSSATLAEFLWCFSHGERSDFAAKAMEQFDKVEALTLKESGEVAIELERCAYNRQETYLDEVEAFVRWIGTHCRT